MQGYTIVQVIGLKAGLKLIIMELVVLELVVLELAVLELVVLELIIPELVTLKLVTLKLITLKLIIVLNRRLLRMNRTIVLVLLLSLARWRALSRTARRQVVCRVHVVCLL